MQKWLPDLAAAAGPKYLAIARAVEDAVRLGELRPGERLPPHREMAKRLSVDLTTVTRAYALLRENGLVEGSGRLGTFIRNTAITAPAEEMGDRGMIMPPQPAATLLPEAIRNGMAQLLRAGGHSHLLEYRPSAGSLHDRKAASDAFAERGMTGSEDDIVITSGGQNALHAIMGTLLAPGERIGGGTSCYPGLLALASRFGHVVVPLACDDEGIMPQALEDAGKSGLRWLYVVPTNDNPTTATMGLARKTEIVSVARRYGMMIIEDDAYGMLPSLPLPSIASLAPECTWHVSSLSKIVSPALRVAHVRAPSAQAAWRLSADIHETAVMAPPLNVALASLWLREGTMTQLVEAVRKEGMARQRIVAPYLRAMDHRVHPEGYHIWLRLRGKLTAGQLAAALQPAGLPIVAGDAFAPGGKVEQQAVRISLGGALDHERLRRLFARLQLFVEQQDGRNTAVI